ncbi:MAG: hypothetical protein P4L84_03820 [Isosphaeraceae bacterium]|nr:hypothetical protein [Isosphaeraceae bacterium]
MTSHVSVAPELPGGEKEQREDQAPGRGASRERLGRARGLLAVGGLLAGVLAFGVGEALYDLIPAAAVTQTALGLTRLTPTVATENAAQARNGALAFGVLGLFLGGCLGLAGGLARRSSFAVAAGGSGSVLGFAAGVGASLALLPFCIASRIRYPDNDLLISFVMHGAIWGLVGALAGLAFAVGLGERALWVRALAAGFAGALIGAVAFDLIGVVAFPGAKTDDPISRTWVTRLMARLLVTVATAAAVSLVLPIRSGESSGPRRA